MERAGLPRYQQQLVFHGGLRLQESDHRRRRWDWQTIPGPGQPGHETWPGDSWKHGGGAVWSGIAVDQATDTLFVAPGNPGPDFTSTRRMGKNLYTNSLVALDIS